MSFITKEMAGIMMSNHYRTLSLNSARPDKRSTIAVLLQNTVFELFENKKSFKRFNKRLKDS